MKKICYDKREKGFARKKGRACGSWIPASGCRMFLHRVSRGANRERRAAGDLPYREYSDRNVFEKGVLRVTFRFPPGDTDYVDGSGSGGVLFYNDGFKKESVK